jgi:hypothetical protein
MNRSKNGESIMKKLATAFIIFIIVIIVIILYHRAPYCLISKSKAEERAFFAMMIDAESAERIETSSQGYYLFSLYHTYNESEVDKSYFEKISISKYKSLAQKSRDDKFPVNSTIEYNFYKLHIACDRYIFRIKKGNVDVFLDELQRTED